MIQFFLRRRVLTNLITLVIIALGIYQFVHIRREAFPDVRFDIVSIVTAYPGASPEEVERLVTLPLEEEIKGVDNIDKVESYSIENRSSIIIWLNEGMSAVAISRAVSDLQQAVARVDDLPEEADSPVVTELTSDRALITVSVAGGTEWDRDAFAEDLKEAIDDVEDVSKIEQEGDRAKEIWVEVLPQRLAQNRITLGEIADALRAENINLSAGSIETGKQELLIRTVGALDTADDVADVIVRGNDERNNIRVRDLATVRETFADEKIRARAGGQPSINLLIKKSKQGDAIVLARQVKKILADWKPKADEKGIQLIISDDFSFFIQRRYNVMKQNMIQGGILIIIALFLFLDWRLALVAAFGVPISFGAALIVAAPLGITINLMSLLAFIIVLGMLDDDSVVVAENIYRHLEMGKKPFQAAVEGTREVMLPVLGSVCATGAAFIPFALTEGIMGKFLFMIPVIVVACFVASVLEAFFILPAHVLDILPFGKPVGENSGGAWYRRVQQTYRTALGWCVDHRYAFLLVTVGVFVLTVAASAWRLKLVMFPEGLIDQFFVQLEMPRGTSLDESQKALEQAERAILKLPSGELDAVTAVVGQTGFEENTRVGTHYAQARVFLHPQEARERSTDAIINELRADFEKIPGLARLTIEKLRPGPPVGNAVQLRVRGDDIPTLKAVADRIKGELSQMKGVTDIRDNFEGGKDELRIGVNHREAAFAGVSTVQIARHILYAFEGGEVTKIRRPTEEVIVKVKLDEESRKRPDSVQRLLVLNERGQQIRLAPLVTLKQEQGPPFIQRYDFKRTVMVTAGVDNVNITSHEANTRIRKLVTGFANEYPGIDAIFGGEEEQTQESMLSLRRGFAVAILLDIVILATLFNSYVQPLIILLTIPIGLIGVAWALILHGQPASFMALLGAVAMTGVVVNNAIVLTDFINEQRRQGKPIREAVIEAGATRLRPIFASSITTLLGLFPTAYGKQLEHLGNMVGIGRYIGGYEPFVAPLCLALAWGLTLAMPLTLFVIPMATLVMDDVRTRVRRFKFWRTSDESEQ